MINPTTPGRYRVTFRGKDGAQEGQHWHYHGLLTYDGSRWLFNGSACDMAGDVKWEVIRSNDSIK